MKKSEFTQKRNLTVNSDQGSFEFTSYADMLGMFNDITNTQEWAKPHKNVVFVAHRFDTIGKIVDTFETEDEAIEYAEQLNEYFAIVEEYSIYENEDIIA